MNRNIVTAALFMLMAPLASAQQFQLTSQDVRQGQEMGADFVQNGSGCTGGDISPQLSWKGAPSGTKSFAITMYDPDAPTGSGWWHWSVVNIPATVHSIVRDGGARSGANLPAGAVQGRTDFARPGYGGACPPLGDTHRYRFKVWALKVDKLDIDTEMSAAQIGYMLGANALGSAELVPISTHGDRSGTKNSEW